MTLFAKSNSPLQRYISGVDLKTSLTIISQNIEISFKYIGELIDF